MDSGSKRTHQQELTGRHCRDLRGVLDMRSLEEQVEEELSTQASVDDTLNDLLGRSGLGFTRHIRVKRLRSREDKLEKVLMAKDIKPYPLYKGEKAAKVCDLCGRKMVIKKRHGKWILVCPDC